MTKNQLLKILAPYPPNSRIVINGYEGGLRDVTQVKAIKIILNINLEWYYGPHEEIDKNTAPAKDVKKAIQLF